MNHIEYDLVDLITKLCSVLDIKCPHDLISINKIAQKNFLRPKQLERGIERWKAKINQTFENKKAEILPILEKLGMVKLIVPSQDNYRYCIIHGAYTPILAERISFLNELAEGIKLKEIFILSSARAITQEELVIARDFHLIKAKNSTEIIASDLVTPLWNQIVTVPYLKKFSPKIISTPMIFVNEAKDYRRPNTEDSIHTWLTLNHLEEGNILAISNNPFIPYQHATLIKCINKEKAGYNCSCLETVGPAAYQDLPITIYLDTLARWVFTLVGTF